MLKDGFLFALGVMVAVAVVAAGAAVVVFVAAYARAVVMNVRTYRKDGVWWTEPLHAGRLERWIVRRAGWKSRDVLCRESHLRWCREQEFKRRETADL